MLFQYYIAFSIDLINAFHPAYHGLVAYQVSGDPSIQSITEDDITVSEGERLALFSTDGFLEIAMNQGKANELLGLYMYDIIRIEFKS